MSCNVANEDLIEKIVEMELEMFRAVNSSVHSPCQDHLRTFKVMRWMHHSVMPRTLLESLHADLVSAREAGRNFMVEKYARMENRIPPLKQSQDIEDIVDAEIDWMREVAQKYPQTFEGGGEGFKAYMSCELEPLSDKTLNLLKGEVEKARKDNRNLVEERYDNLFKRLGYESLQDREKKYAAEKGR
jgi:hypothetical protein